MMSPMSSKKVKTRKRSDEGGEDEDEVGDELAHDVVVEEEGKAGAEDAADAAEDGRRCRGVRRAESVSAR